LDLRGWIYSLLLLFSFYPAYAVSSAQQVELGLADQVFLVEYVADPDSRRQGLMGRENLADGTGMLFDFPEGTEPSIWMRNMVISLDLLYIDSTGRIAQIFSDVPPCRAMPCEIYHANQPLRFVLEVPAGTAKRLELEEGQKLELGGIIEKPAPQW
tara:strand:+ start:2990 stop:3457 length:468 start_codon:yes stop_codon:yes gene_type:complete